MPTLSPTFTLEELFGMPPSPPPPTTGGAALSTPSGVTSLMSKAAVGACKHDPPAPSPSCQQLPMEQRLHREVSSSRISASPPIVRLLPRCESSKTVSLAYHDVHRDNADYSAISTSLSRVTTHSSFAVLSSAGSPESGSGDGLSSLAAPAVKRLPGATPSVPVFSDAVSEDAAVTPATEEAYTTIALLRRFLEVRASIRAEGHSNNSSNSAPAALPTGVAAHHGAQVFDALRSADLVQSVVPIVGGAEAHAEAATPIKPEPGLYRVGSTYMRGPTLATVLKRQKADRRATYSAAHPFFHNPESAAAAAATTSAVVGAAAAPMCLPAVLDMPLHLRCLMCQKHDAMCNRCHQRWSALQESHREEAALRCYSMLEVSRRPALALLTAACGTGTFLEVMSIADGLALTQTRVWVTAASMEGLLQGSGRVLSTTVEERLARAEDVTAGPSRGMWLKVAHVACLCGRRDVLRSLWLRCRGGCSYAAQITTGGLHALELLAEPYEPALVAVLRTCSPLREYLLWARLMQCLAVKADDDAEVAQLCDELCRTGSWVGVWSAALVAYVKGDKGRCVELCDELLASAEAPAAAAAAGAAATATTKVSTLSSSAVSHRGASAISSSSSFTVSNTPPPLPAAAASPQSLPQQTVLTSAAVPSLSVRPPMEVRRIQALRELAVCPEQPLPRLEATEEEEAAVPTPPVCAAMEALAVAPETAGEEVRRLRVRRLAFSLLRRIVSYCDAHTLLSLHEATPMPLLRWVTLARIKCLPAAQWTRLLTANHGYPSLMSALCVLNSPPAPTLQEAKEDAAASVSGSTRECARAAAALACPPFQPIRVSVVDIHDLSDLTVRAVTLGHRADHNGSGVVEAQPYTVGEWLLPSLFGRSTSFVSRSKYLVLSRVFRITAHETDANVASSDVSAWDRTCLRPWEVDVDATIRWCAYVQQHAEATNLV